jgi:hypothetical protein
MDSNTVAKIGLYVQIGLFCIQIPTLIALIVYVAKTWEMASATRKSAEIAENTILEMREARDQEIAPYVVAYFDVIPEQDLIYLVIKNIGKSMATDIRLEFSPPLEESSECKYYRKVMEVLANNSISSIPPGYEIRTILHSFGGYLKSRHPLRYEITVSYYGGISSTQRTVHYTLNLTPYMSVTFVRQTGLKDIERQLANLVSSGKKVAETLRRQLANSEYGDGELEAKNVPELPDIEDSQETEKLTEKESDDTYLSSKEAD